MDTPADAHVDEFGGTGRIARRIVAAARQLGSLLPGRGRRRDAARRVRPWRDDAAHGYATVGLTPSRLRSFLQAADYGSPRMQFELFGEMLEKWPRLAAVAATRRLALTGLEWEIVAGRTPGERPTGRSAATDAADFCRETLAGIDRFDEVLEHLAGAIGYGLAVAELVWERGALVDIVPVPYTRLIADANEPWRLRVLTEEEPTTGVPLDAQPRKWVVHRPRAVPGRWFEGGLLRVSAVLFLAQNLSFKDWLVYSQIAGAPVRVAQFEPGTPESEREALLRMLRTLGTDAAAVVSKNVELKFIESPRGGERPYQPLQDYCNTEVTILWLGQHLTTDLQGSGSRAAAEVHERVREDLLADDIADEARTLRRDVLTPLVRATFETGVPVPQFRRSLVQALDTRVLAETLAVAAGKLGLAVPRRWAHQALGIPQAEGDEAVLATGSGT